MPTFLFTDELPVFKNATKRQHYGCTFTLICSVRLDQFNPILSKQRMHTNLNLSKVIKSEAKITA
jgi:hypothetical protein